MPDADASRAGVSGLAGVAGTRFTRVEWFESIDSTNRHLVERARAGAPEGLVAVADAQTAGRGRLGRSWEAPPGASLLVSVLLRPRAAVEHWPLLASAAGLAARQAVVAVCDVAAQLKWPNDLVVGGRKLAGVLAEAEPASGAVVVGLGLNVAWPSVPPELDGIATAVSLEGGRVVDRAVLLREWLVRYDAWLHRLEQPSGAAELSFSVASSSATLGARVRVDLGRAEIVGRAVELAPTGELVVVDDAGVRHTVAVGDVVHLRAV